MASPGSAPLPTPINASLLDKALHNVKEAAKQSHVRCAKLYMKKRQWIQAARQLGMGLANATGPDDIKVTIELLRKCHIALAQGSFVRQSPHGQPLVAGQPMPSLRLAPHVMFRGSKILTNKELITTFEKLHGCSMNWKLIFQASRDGWQPSHFHNRCDNTRGTLLLVRATPSNFIFGGYTAARFDGEGYKRDPTAYLFSLVNRNTARSSVEKAAVRFPVLEAMKAFALKCHPNAGPHFGASWGQLSLAWEANSDLRTGRCLSWRKGDKACTFWPDQELRRLNNMFLAGTETFTAMEVEVFKVPDGVVAAINEVVDTVEAKHEIQAITHAHPAVTTPRPAVSAAPTAAPSTISYDDHWPFPGSHILQTPSLQQSLRTLHAAGQGGLASFPTTRHVRWQLVYRASRDGWDASTFHQRCDNASSSLVIVKSSTNFVFGGYTSASWESGGSAAAFSTGTTAQPIGGHTAAQAPLCKRDVSAYIFSLVNRSGSSKSARVRIDIREDMVDSAVQCHPSWGPVFGGGLGQLALGSQDDSKTSVKGVAQAGDLRTGRSLNWSKFDKACTYWPAKENKRLRLNNSFLAGGDTFSVMEVEVFQMDEYISDDDSDTTSRGGSTDNEHTELQRVASAGAHVR